MTLSPLDELVTEEFLLALGADSSAVGLRRAVLNSPVVRKLQRALKIGEVTEEAIREFVGDLLTSFRHRGQFLHEPALAAIAVILETRDSPFVAEYLIDLARLRIAELPV